MQSVSITTKVVSSNSTVEISLDKPSKTFSSFVVNFSSEYFGESHHCKNLKFENFSESQLKMVSPEFIFVCLF